MFECYNIAMLAQLLSSKPKTNLINLFLAHPQRSFSPMELRITSGCPNKLLVVTIKELIKMGFLLTSEKKRVKYYQVNKHFALYPELISLLKKSKHAPQDLLSKAVAKVGDCKFIALTGVFVGKPRIETDVLLVGKISKNRLEKFLKLAEKFAEQEIGYTIFSASEFEYRKIMNDRFIKNVLENGPAIVLDKTKNRSISKLVYKL